MALTYRLTEIANWQELRLEVKGNWVKTQAIIYMTMFVGMGQITEANADEFYRRARIVEAVTGFLYATDQGPQPITREDVQRYVGLKTNVFPQESTAKFMAKERRLALERVLREHDAKLAAMAVPEPIHRE